MKWFEHFLQKIVDLVPVRDPDETLKALAKLDPDHIEIENVRSVLNVSSTAAVRVCETAVRKGLFLRKFAFYCPDNSVALVREDLNGLPETVSCWHETEDGPERQQVDLDSLERREFYALA